MKSFNVFGTKYKVVRRQLEGLDGLCDKNKKIITLNSYLKGSELLSVLLHELLHATLHETGVDQTINDAQEEIIVYNCERIIDQIFKISLKDQ